MRDLSTLLHPRRVPLVRQTEATECGLACLAMVAGFHGYRVDLAQLRHRFRVSLKGMTLRALLRAGEQLGLAGRPLRLEPDGLAQLRLPAILHWDFNHFVVLERVGPRHFDICDPGTGRRRYSRAEFDPHFTGVALELLPTADFQPRRAETRLPLSALWQRINGLAGVVTQVLLLTVLLQLFALLTPFYLQLVVDEVLVKADLQLLSVLAAAFAGVVVLQALTQWLRGYVIIAAGSLLSYQIGLNVFAHLVRLPVAFFQSRHVGDLISRFESSRAVQEFITHRLVEAVVDGLMASLTLLVLFVYSPLLAGVVLAALLLHLAVRSALYGPSRREQENALVAQARADSQFIETLRGITTVRLFGREAERQQVWQNELARQINAEARLGRLQVGHETGQTLIFGLELIAVVFLAAQQVLAGAFTVGMLFAFMAYRQQVVSRAATLIDHLLAYRLLDLHLQRLADIVTTEREPVLESAEAAPVIRAGRLVLHDVAFRYAPAEPWLFEHIDFALQPGECVAIVGPSGTGKTTLLKLLLGLLSPERGELRIDDRTLSGSTLAGYRRQVGAVMQEDLLFSGSVIENITFFDPQPDLEYALECARLAALDTEIAAMPMGYDSLVGDMGTALSGGQKQRLLIARALYRRPRILFLDESTSELDDANEHIVEENLRGLGISRVVIAHRHSTIRRADRVLRLTPTGLVSVSTMP